MSCVACQKPLTLTIEPDDVDDVDPDIDSSSVENVYTVPDSVEMQCGCHFHWQCLLDACSMTECPNCGRGISTTGASGEQQILCNLDNEGGLQAGLDILPLLTEESYLTVYPEERRCRAFLEFCTEGDVEAIVDLLDDDQDDVEDISDIMEARKDVLRYQDPMGSMSSGLHAAILGGREEVAWLMLLLASDLPMNKFPAEVLQAAERLGVAREDQNGKIDVRILRDAEGMTGEQRAREIRGTWDTWIESGRLTTAHV